MSVNSFSLHHAAKSVTQMLRAKLQTGANGDSSPELHAALEEIQSLWEELQSQSTALASERQRYLEFFEYAPEGYVITEPQGEIREANRAARELLGLKVEEFEGKSIVDFLPEADRAAFRGRLVAVRGRPEGEAEEWQGRVAAGGNEAGTPVVFRVRAIKIRRKNAEGLCWLLRHA